MNSIDFEKDQAEAITQTNEVKALSDQVLGLRSLEDEVKHKEDELKKLNPKAKTVPQIFVGDKLIGGYMEFMEYCESALGANVDSI